jgi:hypothetical protein
MGVIQQLAQGPVEQRLAAREARHREAFGRGIGQGIREERGRQLAALLGTR